MKRLRITVEGKSYDVEVELLDDSANSPKQRTSLPKDTQSPTSKTQPADVEKVKSSVSGGENDIASPLAAVIVSVDVAVGDAVKAGQKVVTLEAMKMNTTVSAPVNGTVESIHVSIGNSVEEGQLLIKLS